MLSCYSCQRRTLQWPLDILDVSAYNAFDLDGVKPSLEPKEAPEEMTLSGGARHGTSNTLHPEETCLKDPSFCSQANGNKRKRCQVCGPYKDTKTQTTCSKYNIHL
ncbi:hypothetical protein AAFF_G00181870 [Aldrovandia affinis]|uniref:Uncharacterized protein n=1 Tax=Aldrovandia affinis TaxID=143900 RepID=A0AAD7RK88_9TELE|nr:hypothetical protein AAFF_G00181870 [Aldrovandia affinis]